MIARREFISLLGGAAAAWPLAARAQQQPSDAAARRAYDPAPQTDRKTGPRSAFLHSLRPLGWTDRQNTR